MHGRGYMRCWGVGFGVYVEGQRRRPQDGGRRRAVVNRNGGDLFLFRGQVHLKVSGSLKHNSRSLI